MLDRSYFPAKLILGGLGWLMPNHLLLGVWVLALRQTGELFGTYRALKSPFLSEPTLPLTMPLLFTAPVVRFFGR